MTTEQSDRRGMLYTLLLPLHQGWNLRTHTIADVDSTLGRLSLSDVQKHPAPNKDAVVDSWEDDLSSGEDAEKDDARRGEHIPHAPPPTPVSPSSRASWSESDSTGPYPSSRIEYGESVTRPSTRPEKQIAVAGRLIAGALGVRAPKKTDEQKAYDRAMKEKEVKRRNKEQEAQARAKGDAERAKAAMWNE